MKHKGIAITKVRLIELFYSELEYSEDEIKEMGDIELVEAFLESGMFEDEKEFGGMYISIPPNLVNFDIVSSVTGIPVSLTQFYKEIL